MLGDLFGPSLWTIVISGLIVALVLGLGKRLRRRIVDISGKVRSWIWRGTTRPIRWAASEIAERRRVSDYKYRCITWSDLTESSQGRVTLHDLSDSARNSVRLRDISQSDKYNLLDRLILPKMWDVPFNGQISLLDDRGAPSIDRDARLTIRKDDQHFLVINQNGMRLDVLIEFLIPAYEIALPGNAKIRFRPEGLRWIMSGTVMTNTPVSAGIRRVEIWIDYFVFDRLAVYTPYA